MAQPIPPEELWRRLREAQRSKDAMKGRYFEPPKPPPLTLWQRLMSEE